VLVLSAVLLSLGLAGRGLAPSLVWYFAAWLVIGAGMGAGLYDAAFATLGRLFGTGARQAIGTLTLFGGFASTVGWPLSAALEHAWGWRGACWAWAGLHLLIGLPLNAALPRAASTPAMAAPLPSAPAGSPPVADTEPPLRTAALLAWVFAVTWFISTAMAAHLPHLLDAVGTAPAAVIAIGALVGPAQVAGRLLEFGFLRRLHPLLSARLAALMHPVGAALLALAGAPVAAVFALLHGAGNGILTIAKGTLPLALFGPAGYGHRQGLLMLPARLGQALSPWLFGLPLARLGPAVLWLSAGLALTALAALLLIHAPAPETPLEDPHRHP
jgi:predicted MFS family arabinose efflux permease